MISGGNAGIKCLAPCYHLRIEFHSLSVSVKYFLQRE